MQYQCKSDARIKERFHALHHTSAGFTLDTYGHITPAMKQDAAEKVGSFLSTAL